MLWGVPPEEDWWLRFLFCIIACGKCSSELGIQVCDIGHKFVVGNPPRTFIKPNHFEGIAVDHKHIRLADCLQILAYRLFAATSLCVAAHNNEYYYDYCSQTLREDSTITPLQVPYSDFYSCACPIKEIGIYCFV